MNTLLKRSIPLFSIPYRWIGMFLPCFFVLHSYAQTAKVSSAVDTTSIKIGEQITFKISV